MAGGARIRQTPLAARLDCGVVKNLALRLRRAVRVSATVQEIFASVVADRIPTCGRVAKTIPTIHIAIIAVINFIAVPPSLNRAIRASLKCTAP